MAELGLPNGALVPDKRPDPEGASQSCGGLTGLGLPTSRQSCRHGAWDFHLGDTSTRIRAEAGPNHNVPLQAEIM